MLELRQVDKREADETHLEDVSLTLEPGSLNVLLGPTRSGKTSLMRVMAGLDRPTAGSVHVDGKDVTGVKVQRRDVAMVYQTFVNYPAMSVYDNIASPLRIRPRARRPDRAAIDRTVREIAELLRLTPYLDRPPLQLSGGQQQRTALARALAKDAQLLLLDEPLANLDYKLREELRVELPKIFARSGAIFVYATAEPEEALLLGGNVATLKEGRVTAFGPTIDVYRQPRTLDTARILSDPPLNVLHVTKAGGAFLHASGEGLTVPREWAGLGEGSYALAVRPHHVHPADPAAKLALPATVKVCEITGSQTYVHLTCLDAPFVMLMTGVHPFEAEQTLHVSFDPANILMFDSAGIAVVPDGERLAA